MAKTKPKPPVTKRHNQRNRHQLGQFSEGRTVQSHKDLCDVNKIIERFDRTGALPPGQGQPVYDDVTGLQGDLTELISQAEQNLSDLQAYQNDLDELAKAEAAKPRQEDKPPQPEPGKEPPTPE